jgi:hypothetical protein
VISQAMRGAELTYRRTLADQTIADVAERVLSRSPTAPADTRSRFANLKS